VKLAVHHLPEPFLEFGQGEDTIPKDGLITGGPYSLRLGNTHLQTVRVGLVGTPATTKATERFIRTAEQGVRSESANAVLAPDFPGFETVFRSRIVRDARFDHAISSDALNNALRRRPDEAFKEVLAVFEDALSAVAERDAHPDVVICCIPQEVIDRCRTVQIRLDKSERAELKRRERERLTGQASLFDLQGSPWTLETAADPAEEDLLRRDFRRALKAVAMRTRIPIQLATPNLWDEGRRNQDPATRAWNLSVALFYKAGGIPWRVATAHDDTCFVGISFHHLITTQRHIVYSSLAQAFSSDGDGFALRGEAIPWDGKTRTPHLSSEKAHSLMIQVLDAYRERAGRNPVRVVVHKTSNYNDAERSGITDAFSAIPITELLTLRSGDFRMVREGTYPPHRGALCRLGQAAFLFTSGYMPHYLTYPGPHVPVPIEIIGDDPERAASAAADVLSLTKMNWNSAAASMALPITLSFARRVGGVMAELPRGVEPHPSFRYYI
jgi:hypothetical protein